MGPSTPGPRAKHPIKLSRRDRRKLNAVVRKHSSPQRDVLRARIVLLAAGGMPNDGIARTLRCAPNTVKKWRWRFFREGRDGLEDRERSGRPPVYPPSTLAVIKVIACDLPATYEKPFSRFSIPDIRDAARELGVRPLPSLSWIRARLREDAIRPWSHHTWAKPRDPDFERKAAPILDLYHGRFEGAPLHPDDVVLSADEKTAIQALHRHQPTTAAGPRRPLRYDDHYTRRGTTKYIAARDVRTGRVVGTCQQRVGAREFRAFVDRVMATARCARARRVFWIVDNGSAHHPKTFGAWLSRRHPKAVAVHTPVHASWLNQIEIYFSILQRKALTPNDFEDVEALERRIKGFERHYNRQARPFKWKFTKADLRRVMERLERAGEGLKGAAVLARGDGRKGIRGRRNPRKGARRA